MKSSILLSIFLLTFLCKGFAQDTLPKLPEEDGKVFAFVESEPKFPGGIVKMMNFIDSVMVYPAEARQKGFCGTVFTTFVVDKNGIISDVKVVKGGIHDLLDNEAKRIIQSMPAWLPGTMNGKPVAVQFNLPIRFRLPDCSPLSSREGLAEKENVEMVEYFVNKGNKAREAEQFPEAESFYTRALEIVPSIDVFYNRAISRLGQGNERGFCADMFVAGVWGDDEADKLYKENCAAYPAEILFPDSTCTLNSMDMTETFPGGHKAESYFLTQTIKYPQGVEPGKAAIFVIINFDIGRDGSIGDMKITSNQDKSFSDEALRVARAMPKWFPKFNKGCPVPSNHTMRIMFDKNQ